MSSGARRADGVALVITLMAMLLLTVLGIGLTLVTSSETIIAGNFRTSAEALYAADAGLERVIDDLAGAPDWNQLLDGTVQSSFIDGPPSGSRRLPNGSTVDLVRAANLANCQKIASCSAAELNAVTAEHPWGANNPRWQLYGYGPLNNLLPAGSIDSTFYVVVFVADDPSENDGDPLRDGASQANPGSGVVALRAEAFGPRSARKVVELTVAKTDSEDVESGYTGQRGHDGPGGRIHSAPVQRPGKALTMVTLTTGGAQ
jgi:hypothetical protein